MNKPSLCFNPAEAREWFKRHLKNHLLVLMMIVSIQPKQENGLRVNYKYGDILKEFGFNPAEAREWFKRYSRRKFVKKIRSFNPAEAREWFKS